MMANNGSVVNIATVSGVSASNVSVQADLSLGANQVGGLIARYQSNGDFYLATVVENATGTSATVYLFKLITGNFAQLGATATVATNGTCSVRLEVVGQELKVFFGPDAVHLSMVTYAYDSSITNAALAGVRGTATTKFDNFTIDALTLMPPPSLPFTDNFNTLAYGNQLSRTWEEKLGNFTVNGNGQAIANDAGLSIATVHGVSLADASVSVDVILGAIWRSCRLGTQDLERHAFDMRLNPSYALGTKFRRFSLAFASQVVN